MRATSTRLTISALFFNSALGYAAVDQRPVIQSTFNEVTKTLTAKGIDPDRTDKAVDLKFYVIDSNNVKVREAVKSSLDTNVTFVIPTKYHDGKPYRVQVAAGSWLASGEYNSSVYDVDTYDFTIQPSANLNINWSDSEIGYQDNASINWQASNVRTCSLTTENYSANSTTGSKLFTALKSNMTATLNCTDLSDNTVSKNATVTVREDRLPVIEGPTGTLTSSTFNAKAYDPDSSKSVALNLWKVNSGAPNEHIATKYTNKSTEATFTIPEKYRTGNQLKFQLAAGSFYENGTYDGKRLTLKVFDVNISPKPPEPTAVLSFNDESVPFGGSATIQWSSENASSCELNESKVPLSGQQTLSALKQSQVHKLVCENEEGKQTIKTAVVNVEPTITFEPTIYSTSQLRGTLNIDGAAPLHELRLTASHNAIITFDDAGSDSQTRSFTVDLPKELRTGLSKNITFTLYDYSASGTLLRTLSHTEDFTKQAWFIEELEQSTPRNITIALAENEQYCLRSQVNVTNKDSVTIIGNNAEILQCELLIENDQEPNLFEKYIKTTNLGLLYFDNVDTLSVSDLRGTFKPASNHSLKRFVENCNDNSECQNASNEELASALWWAHWYKLTFTERVVFDHSFIYTENVGSVNLSKLKIKDFVKGIFISNDEKDYSYNIDDVQFDGILDNLHSLIPFKLDLYGTADGDKNTVSPSVVFSKVDGLESAYTSSFNNIVDFTQPGASIVAGFKFYDIHRGRVARFDEKLCAPWAKTYYNLQLAEKDEEGNNIVVPELFYKDCINADNANVAIVIGKPSQNLAYCEEDTDGKPLTCNRSISNVKVWNNGPAVVHQGRHDHAFITGIQCNVGENPFEETLDLGSHGDNCVYVSYGKKVTISDVETHSIRGAIVKVRGVLSHIENVRGDNALFAVSLQSVNDSSINITENDKFFENKYFKDALAPHAIELYSSYINNVNITNSKQALVHVQDYQLSGDYRKYIAIGDNVSISYGGTGWGSSAKASFICEGAHNSSAFNHGDRPLIVELSTGFENLFLDNYSLIRTNDPNRECFLYHGSN